MTLVPVEHTSFAPIVENITWDTARKPKELSVATDLGCLVSKDEFDTSHLVVFCDVNSEERRLYPPQDLSELPEHLQNFNNDFTAKGLSIPAGNTPESLVRSHESGGVIAVRSMAMYDEEDVLNLQGSDSRMSQVLRWCDHGFRFLKAEMIDRYANSKMGTELAMMSRESRYGNAKAVIVPTPPSWRAVQRRRGIDHGDITPHKVLMRYAEYQPLVRLGEFDPANLRVSK